MSSPYHATQTAKLFQSIQCFKTLTFLKGNQGWYLRIRTCTVTLLRVGKKCTVAHTCHSGKRFSPVDITFMNVLGPQQCQQPPLEWSCVVPLSWVRLVGGHLWVRPSWALLSKTPARETAQKPRSGETPVKRNRFLAQALLVSYFSSPRKLIEQIVWCNSN